MALIPRVVDAVERHGTSLTQRDTKDLREYELPLRHETPWQGFFSIFQKPWFRRGWIIQESAVASSLILCCGSDIVTFDHLVMAMVFANNIGFMWQFNAPDTSRAWTIALTREATKHKIQQSLLSLLQSHRLALLTDPRDRIFSLCGIACDAGLEALNIQLDYHRSFLEVYWEVAVQMLSKQKSLDILSIPNEKGRSRQMPSWVPDYGSSTTTAPLFSTYVQD